MAAAPSLSHRLVNLLRRPVSETDRARAALHLIDWLGCAAAGLGTPSGQAMLAYARNLPPGPCRVVGGLSLAARDAALVNGSPGNVLEMDDFHRTALVHPGPVVVPAALAVAEAANADGTGLLDAIVLGFETMIRIGRSVGPAHYRLFHNTATCGVFGAAVAAGDLLRLDDDQMISAIGNAGTQAAGLWQCRLEDVMTKQLHNGRAAQCGVVAAELAACGFTGPVHILDGPLGFFSGLCPDGAPEVVIANPDAPFLIHETSFKPWPACRHAHPTIDAALALREAIDAGDVESAEVASYRDAVTVCDNATPRTAVEAKFSLQHAAAVVLLRGRPALSDFDLAALDDEEVAALRRRISLSEDAALTSAYPAHFGARLSVVGRDGATVEHAVADALGDPERALSDGEIVAKARMLLAAAGYESAKSDALVAAVEALRNGGPVSAVTATIQ